MELHPLLATLRRNKIATLLIVCQIAVTLAIVCNGLFIIQQHLALSHRFTGTDEADLFAIQNVWVGRPANLASRLQTDLQALRSLPGVVGAYATNSYPLANAGSGAALSTRPDDELVLDRAAVYFADEHAIRTLGIKLLAGRNFTATEVTDLGGDDVPRPNVIIVTRTLAQKLFPTGSALGQALYPAHRDNAMSIVGIVEKLQVPWTAAGGLGSTFNDNSILFPFRLLDQETDYVVRAEPGQLAAVMTAARQALIAINRARILEKIQPFTAARVEAYRDDRGLAVILGVVCLSLLVVTAFGIVGLTSYWVSQRRRQIGIRRALGATRIDIMRLFHTENLLIASVGILAGMALAVALNLWMISSLEMARLPPTYFIVGAVIVFLLGQLAVFWPAVRAAAVSPALVARSA